MIDTLPTPPAIVEILTTAPIRELVSNHYYWVRTTQSGDHWFLARRVRGRWIRSTETEPLQEMVIQVGPKMAEPVFMRGSN